MIFDKERRIMNFALTEEPLAFQKDRVVLLLEKNLRKWG